MPLRRGRRKGIGMSEGPAIVLLTRIKPIMKARLKDWAAAILRRVAGQGGPR